MKKLILLSFYFITLFAINSYSGEVLGWIQYGNAANTTTKAKLDANSKIEDALTTIALQFWNTASDGSIPFVSDENTASDVIYWRDRAKGKGIKTYMTVTCIYGGHAWNPYVIDALMNNRSDFVNNILDTVDHYNLDGVDIDLEAGWRIGTAEGLNEYPLFLKELKDSLSTRGKKLSMAIFAGDDPTKYNNYPQVYDAKEWLNKVDYVNVMGYQETYEGNGNLSYTYILNTFRSKGFDSSSINLGLPAYVASWGGGSPTANIEDVNSLDGGACIWDLKLTVSAWLNDSVWNALKVIKDKNSTQYSVTSSTNIGGTIDPSGIVGIDSATNKTFTITPDQYFIIDYVEVDGKNKGNTSSYEFTNVLKDHTIKAYFKEDPLAPKLSTVTATANTNGAISPSGTTVKANGTTYSFTVTANSGYAVDYVKIDGVKRGPIISGDIKNILKDHSIESFYKTASGGDLGKYDIWVADQYSAGDLVTYDGRIWKAKWSVQPTEGYPGITDGGYTSGWEDIGAYNDQPDSLITATLDYRSAANGSDTLIIKTDTVVSGSNSGSNTDTTILNATSIKSRHPISKFVATILVSQNGTSFIAPETGNYTIKMFNLKGRIILQNSIAVSHVGTVSTGLKLNSLSTGIYLISIDNGAQKKIQRIKF